jgi:Protein of unknown function (DUF808)
LSIGLIALLDDTAAIAKLAAASLDDVVAQAAKAGVKAAGVVVDDAAVTPRYVLGFAAKRELPIVGKIAAGSLRNPSRCGLADHLAVCVRFCYCGKITTATSTQDKITKLSSLRRRRDYRLQFAFRCLPVPLPTSSLLSVSVNAPDPLAIHFHRP